VVAAIVIAATAMTAANFLVAVVIDPFRVPPSIAPLIRGYWDRVSVGSQRVSVDRSISSGHWTHREPAPHDEPAV